LTFAVYKVRSNRLLLLGVLFYLDTVALVVHVIEFGTNIYLADRYAYIPCIGIIIAFGGLYEELRRKWESEKGRKGDEKSTGSSPTFPLSHLLTFSVIILLLSYLTYNQNKVWKDSTALWT